MRPAAELQFVARNTAESSENRIHEDSVARRYGFRGGLVPGVTTIAYLMEAALHLLGPEFLSRGEGFVRLTSPVYDGDVVTARAEPNGDGRLALSALGPEGQTVADGWAGLGDGAPPRLPDFPAAPLPGAAERPAASEEAFRERVVLGTLRARFDPAEARRYLAEVGLGASPAELQHPGLGIRYANWVLSANVRLGPWVHVSSGFSIFGAPEVGAEFETRARVLEVFERKGHRFVRLDVGLFAGERPLLRVDHTAIYELRPPA
ncbi:hypothetical protein HRbin29_01175 [bacterium HR29]|jgi:hypothetical protein|nr:hypothetical protein HRbin29_01175 [bacterium HR29]